MFDWKWRLATRILSWSVFGALMWALLWQLLTAIVLELWNFALISNGSDGVEFSLHSIFLAGLYPTLVFAPRYALVGALCGFYAPARQQNPFRSPFLWRVIREVWSFGIIGFLVAAFSGVVVARLAPLFGFKEAAYPLGFCGFVLLEFSGFGLTLWRALNRALQAEK